LSYADYIEPVAETVVETIRKKDSRQAYGGSWLKRGGVGAFMMLARKWDRIELAAQQCDVEWDVIRAAQHDKREEDVEEDINDLIGYLILVSAEIRRRRVTPS
jgi:hypothetical protein